MATDNELIERVRGGGRVGKTEGHHVLHDSETSRNCQHPHGWRTIVCNDIEDVVECSDCGQQRVAKCNFDDEYC